MKQIKHAGLILILFIPLLSISQEKNKNEIDSAISSFFRKTHFDMEANEKPLLNTSNYMFYKKVGYIGRRSNSQCNVISILKSISSNFVCDSTFIEKQLNDTNNYSLKSNDFKEVTLISENEIGSYPEEVIVISRPLLTSDFNFIIVGISTARGDVLMKGSINIYKKTGVEYQFIKEVCNWVY